MEGNKAKKKQVNVNIENIKDVSVNREENNAWMDVDVNSEENNSRRNDNVNKENNAWKDDNVNIEESNSRRDVNVSTDNAECSCDLLYLLGQV